MDSEPSHVYEFVDHGPEIMCCRLGADFMCKNCHHLKRKFAHPLELLSLDVSLRVCVACALVKPRKQMRLNTQFVDKVDNICQQCFVQNYAPLLSKQKGVKRPSLRVIRFGINGQERRCARSRHWIHVDLMHKDKTMVDGVGFDCEDCFNNKPKRKVAKSIRKHAFGGRKIKKHEIQGLKEKLFREDQARKKIKILAQ